MTSSNSQRHLLILFAFCLVIQGCTSRVTDTSRVIDIGNGRSIFLECKGNGRPTVILVTGLAERADDWMITTNNKQPVFQGVASFTTVCSYDRPGTVKATEKGWELSRAEWRAVPSDVTPVQITITTTGAWHLHDPAFTSLTNEKGNAVTSLPAGNGPGYLTLFGNPGQTITVAVK
jgi:hypothetical protein